MHGPGRIVRLFIYIFNFVLQHIYQLDRFLRVRLWPLLRPVWFGRYSVLRYHPHHGRAPRSGQVPYAGRPREVQGCIQRFQGHTSWGWYSWSCQGLGTHLLWLLHAGTNTAVNIVIQIWLWLCYYMCTGSMQVRSVWSVQSILLWPDWWRKLVRIPYQPVPGCLCICRVLRRYRSVSHGGC